MGGFESGHRGQPFLDRGDVHEEQATEQGAHTQDQHGDRHHGRRLVRVGALFPPLLAEERHGQDAGHVERRHARDSQGADAGEQVDPERRVDDAVLREPRVERRESGDPEEAADERHHGDLESHA